MIANLIIFYYTVIGITVIMSCVGYLRGMGRSIVRLAYLAVIAAISFPLANLLSYPMSPLGMNWLMSKIGKTASSVASANPALLFTLRNVITAVLTPILTAVIFVALEALSLIYFEKLSSKLVVFITKGKSVISEKSSRIVGTCIGAVSGLLMLFVILTPVAFGSSILVKTPMESLESIDSGYLSKVETVSEEPQEGALKKQGKPRSSLRLKPLRKGLAIFSDMSQDYMIYGFDESAQTELSNLLAAAGDVFASFEFSLEINPDDKLTAYLNTVAALGANTEHSPLITNLVKEASRAVGNLEEEKISEMLSSVPHADIIAGVLPGIFAAIADTPDEDIPMTFATFFGDPPVEPARTKELREKAEKEALTDDISVDATEELTEPTVTDTSDTEPTVTDAPQTNKPTTQAPQTGKPSSQTTAPVTKAPSETSAKPSTTAPTTGTTKAPETAKPAETTKKQETTKAPETTKVPETTKAPVTTTAPDVQSTPTAGGNSGLLGALLGGGSVSNKTDDLTKNKALFDSIRNGAFKAISSKLDITKEDYAWMYILIRNELSNVLKEVKSNPNMTYREKVDFFAASITQNMNEVVPPEAYKEFGLDFILKPSSMEVIAIFTLDEFTLEKYPNCNVPLKDIMVFMGIAKKDIPDWVKKYN